MNARLIFWQTCCTFGFLGVLLSHSQVVRTSSAVVALLGLTMLFLATLKDEGDGQ